MGISYGSITVTDITDITDVYLQYGLALANATVTNSYAFNGTGEVGWSTTYPTWVSGYQIWVREVTVKEGIVSPEYGTPYLDKAVNQINTNYVDLSNKLKTFFYPGDINHNYSGAFAVSKTESDGLNTANADTYGFNTRVATGLISMGYNKIPLLEMGLFETGTPANGIKLYSPILTNGVITNHRLDATLTSEGLKLLKGGIVAGDYAAGQNGYIYLSTENGPRISINGFTPGTGQNDSQWRAIIGTNFGVLSDGSLYASNVKVGGEITATTGSISGSVIIGGTKTATTVLNDIQEAGTTATSYLTDISGGGVYVHSSDTPSSSSAENAKGVKITDHIDIIRNGESVAEFGETARIGKDENGYSRLTIDPYFHDGVNNIFSIKASQSGMDYSVNAHELVFDENVTRSDWRIRSFNAPYITGSIGSESSPLNQRPNPLSDYSTYKKMLGNTTFIINEISNIADGTNFDVLCRAIFGYKIGNNTHYFTGISSSSGVFTKSTSSTPQTHDYNTSLSGTLLEIKTGFYEKDMYFQYVPSTNSFTINFGVVLGESSVTSTCWIERVEIYGLNVYESGVLVPIHRLHGKVEIEGNITNYGSSDLKLQGNICVNNSNFPIGWYDVRNGTDNIDHSTDFREIASSAITLQPSSGGNGRYLLFGSIRFDGNANGYRGIAIKSINSGIIQRSTAIVQALNASWKTRLNVSCFYNMGTSQTDTLFLCGLQNKGSGTLSCDWDFYAVKIR